MTIPQPVINTFRRVGIDPGRIQIGLDSPNKVKVFNRLSGEFCETNESISSLIEWVYATSNRLEMGTCNINISDFDRIRHFILKCDSNAYMTCID